MPWLFVLIWATGFVVARLAMPHAPPFSFLSLRFALSAASFLVWIAISRPPWPAGRMQWLHLAVTGLLMQAGYLGGVWTAVKAGLGAGTSALLVSLQPVLTALWLSRDAPAREAAGVSSRSWLGLALGFAGITLVVWPKVGGEVTLVNLVSAIIALLSISIGTLYQKRFVERCDVRTASAVQMAAAFVVCLPLALFEAEPMRLACEPRRRHGVVGRRPHARRQFAPLPDDPAWRGDRGDQPHVSCSAVHRAAGVGNVRRVADAGDDGWNGARRGRRRARRAPAGAKAPGGIDMKKTHRIAVIPGDGIGTEVVARGLAGPEAAAGRFGIELGSTTSTSPAGDFYEQHGR